MNFAADSFSVDMEALDYKEQCQQLQEAGRYEEALLLMLRSVKLREGSHTLVPGPQRACLVVFGDAQA